MTGHEDCAKRESSIAAAWARAEDRARELEAERDRYKAALEEIAALPKATSNVAGDIAKRALQSTERRDDAQ